jgi:uncharacterized protein (DUF58 family)
VIDDAAPERPQGLIRHATTKLPAFIGLAGLGLIAALVLGLPELVALAAPFALVAAAGLAFAERSRVEAGVELARELTVEGEDLEAQLKVWSATGVERLDLVLDLPQEIELVQGASPISLSLERGEERTLEFTLHGRRWGGYTLGSVGMRAYERFGLFADEGWFERLQPLKVHPRPEAMKELLRPQETQVFSGNQVAREKGEGIEFADLRRFVPGDRPRRINWRASARRDELWVNELHAERNADVILFLDSFSEAGGEGESTLDRAVRAAAALATNYLTEKDRVGFVSFGGVLNWLLPSTGLVQLYRIVDSLLDTEIVFNYAWKDLEVIPRRTLPPKALIVALTPLLDARAVGVLLDLRARGFDLAIVEISPEPFAIVGGDELERVAHRLWLLRREALRARYERFGVPLAVWDDDASFLAALEEVRIFRRYAPRVPVL